MSTGYQINDQEGLYYLTFQIVDWIDIFTRQVYRDIVIESFRYSIQYKDFSLFAFVIMSNHVHLIAQSNVGRLSDTVRDIKKFTSKRILETIESFPESRKEWMLNRFSFSARQTKHNKTYQLWTHENHAVYLYSPEFILEKIDYLHNNPVRAGLVEKPEEYIYSSARYYAGLECLLPIIDIGLPWKTI
jgi:REP element-mobilizing transposase RayT